MKVRERMKHDAYISKILHVAHKIAFRIDHFIDSLLSSFLRVRHAVHDFLWHRVYPESPGFLVSVILKTVTFHNRSSYHKIP